jgi:hypothetical protein
LNRQDAKIAKETQRERREITILLSSSLSELGVLGVLAVKSLY